MKGNFFCPHCSIEDIDTNLIEIIKNAEILLKRELYINSGARCAVCNEKVDGASRSAHIVTAEHKCKAFDISLENGHDRFEIMKTMLSLGIKRFGCGRSFWHIDIDEDNPQDVIWTYYA